MPVGEATAVHSRVQVADCGVAGLRVEEFGRTVAALHGDVDVVVRGDLAVGGGRAGEAGQVDGVDSDAHTCHHRFAVQGKISPSGV